LIHLARGNPPLYLRCMEKGKKGSFGTKTDGVGNTPQIVSAQGAETTYGEKLGKMNCSHCLICEGRMRGWQESPRFRGVWMGLVNHLGGTWAPGDKKKNVEEWGKKKREKKESLIILLHP